MPNGIFQTSTATSFATGTANTPATLFSATVPGASVADENAVSLHADVSLYGSSGVTGSAKITFNGVTIYEQVMAGSGTFFTADIRVWRTDNNNGVAEGMIHLDGASSRLYPIFLTGLAWNNGQAFAVVGQSNQEGGCILDRAGIQR